MSKFFKFKEEWRDNWIAGALYKGAELRGNLKRTQVRQSVKLSFNLDPENFTWCDDKIVNNDNKDFYENTLKTQRYLYQITFGFYDGIKIVKHDLPIEEFKEYFNQYEVDYTNFLDTYTKTIEILFDEFEKHLNDLVERTVTPCATVLKNLNDAMDVINDTVKLKGLDRPQTEDAQDILNEESVQKVSQYYINENRTVLLYVQAIENRTGDIICDYFCDGEYEMNVRRSSTLVKDYIKIDKEQYDNTLTYLLSINHQIEHLREIQDFLLSSVQVVNPKKDVVKKIKQYLDTL